MAAIKAIIYRQAFEEPYHSEFIFDGDSEYMKVKCNNCNNGVFHINEDYSEICVECRGTTYKWCNMC